MEDAHAEAKETALSLLRGGADPDKLKDLALSYEERAPMVTLGALDALDEYREKP
ncbi:hypothetical protein ABT352_33135 [Streptosporangium sp. NPDC000563]|uniref:hypothetical protein n=1 Tax=Streptosporangium sp. NPDC000563 TaxID=3154366 RepID=UPI0033258EDF